MQQDIEQLKSNNIDNIEACNQWISNQYKNSARKNCHISRVYHVATKKHIMITKYCLYTKTIITCKDHKDATILNLQIVSEVFCCWFGDDPRGSAWPGILCWFNLKLRCSASCWSSTPFPGTDLVSPWGLETKRGLRHVGQEYTSVKPWSNLECYAMQKEYDQGQRLIISN